MKFAIHERGPVARGRADPRVRPRPTGALAAPVFRSPPRYLLARELAVDVRQRDYGEALDAVRDVLRSPGSPLPPSVKEEMEERFGADFSSVRIHDGPEAAASARGVDALAYTVGHHIVFGPGQAPRVGRLLAHELAHVLQQDEAGAGEKLAVGDPETAAEREAASAADALEAGGVPMRCAAERPGQPLDNHALARLGPGRAEFSDDVRAHVVFERGEYPPVESEGTGLLTHELAHVAQEPAAPVSEVWDLPKSAPTDASEQAAAAEGSRWATARPGELAAKPTIRRVLAAYSSVREDILPSMGETAWVTSVRSTADSARVRAALAALIAARKVEVASVGDRDFYSLPATGAATSAEVLAAFSAAGFARAVEMTAVLMDRHNAKLFTGEQLYQLHGLWTQTISRDRDVIRQTDRPLTSEETAEARLVFGPGLNYSAIRITEDPLLGAGGIARTIPSGINFPVGASSSSGFTPWLIHELTHSWQYQHGRSVFATATRALLCWAGVSTYSYGGKPALVAAAAAGRGLSSFNTEQQGDIARDYYLDVKAGASVAEYAPFLTEFRTP